MLQINICMYVCMYVCVCVCVFFFRLFSIIVYYKVSDIVPYAIQQVLVVYPNLLFKNQEDE